MSVLTFGGLASGLDNNAIVDALVASERTSSAPTSAAVARVQGAAAKVSAGLTAPAPKEA
jgi:hypothetical protein